MLENTPHNLFNLAFQNVKRRLTLPSDCDSLSEGLGPHLGENVRTEVLCLFLKFRIQLVFWNILNISLESFVICWPVKDKTLLFWKEIPMHSLGRLDIWALGFLPERFKKKSAVGTV